MRRRLATVSIAVMAVLPVLTDALAEPRIRNICTSKSALDALIIAYQTGNRDAAMDARHKCLGSVAVDDLIVVRTGALEGYMTHSFCRAVVRVKGRLRYVPLDAPMCKGN